MPSHYEPCGMNQIYSMKYGTVPVVRAVGGLDDTVEQFDPRTMKGRASSSGVLRRSHAGHVACRNCAVSRQPAAWQTLMRNGMAQDYSWTNSAREYVKVYERARQIKQQSANG